MDVTEFTLPLFVVGKKLKIRVNLKILRFSSHALKKPGNKQNVREITNWNDSQELSHVKNGLYRGMLLEMAVGMKFAKYRHFQGIFSKFRIFCLNFREKAAEKYNISG